MMYETDVNERLSPSTPAQETIDDSVVISHARRPTRVPSIKIEPPCDKESVCDEDLSSTSRAGSTTPVASTASSSVNLNTLSPSMSPNHRPVDLRNQPGNYKKNLTARFLQQGHSEDDGYYRSQSDNDLLQPDEKRSRSLDRGLDWEPTEVQPLDLSTQLAGSSSELRRKFNARARKMHDRRNRTDAADENDNSSTLTSSSSTSTDRPIKSTQLVTMQRLSHSDMQLDRMKPAPQHNRSTTPCSIPSPAYSFKAHSFNTSLTESDAGLSGTESHDNDPSSLSSSPRPPYMLPPIGMLYNRGASSSGSTDGSLDFDHKTMPSVPPAFPQNPTLPLSFANLYGQFPNDISPLSQINAAAVNLNVAALLEWQQVQNRLNQTVVNQCLICKQTFTGVDNMAKHVAKHLPTEVKTDNNNRVHMCKVCDRSFARSDMLTRHMRLHTGLKPYECKVCGQVFSRSDHLNTHKRTHTGEKPYQCPKCSYAACRRDMITRHMRIHTNKDVSKKRRRLLNLKDSASGSSVESSDSVPSRGSISGNSFDSSFESSDLRWSQRHNGLLDPANLMRVQNARSWSAPNSVDLLDTRRGAWSSLTSADSIESDAHSLATSIDNELMPSPPRQNTLSPSSSTNTLSPRAKGDTIRRRPSLVRQDASLDHDDHMMNLPVSKSPVPPHSPVPPYSPAPPASVPFNDYKQAYRLSVENRSMDCTDDNESVATERDSVGTADSPRPIDSPLPPPNSDTVYSRRLSAISTLPKQASLSDELNLQKCALNE